MYILSGTQFLLMESITQSLRRAAILKLAPLSVFELDQREYCPRILTTGFSQVDIRVYMIRLTRLILSELYQTYVERDVRLLRNYRFIGIYSFSETVCRTNGADFKYIRSAGNVESR